jgi:uncharacterized protein (DUF2147 family)
LNEEDISMFPSVIAVVLSMLALSAMAQVTPVGLWQTISDKDGSVTSEVRITEAGGALSGKIERQLRSDAKADATCTECKDDRKGQMITGLEIIRGAKKSDGKEVWEGGNIVDPDNGTVYKLKMTPIDGGKKLEVRGFVGFALLGRTQTWVRAQ